MKDDNKPSDQIKKQSIDGKVVIDKYSNPNRKFVLRTPNLIDEFYIAQALGDASSNWECRKMANLLPWVAAIDDSVMSTPHTYNELIAALGRLKIEGRDTVWPEILKHMGLLDENGDLISEEEQEDKIKK